MLDETTRGVFTIAATPFLPDGELDFDSIDHMLAERYPAFAEHAPGWAEEGICQYTSAMLCRDQKFKAQLESIETCDHPAYGDGYRFFATRFGNANWPTIAAWWIFM